ncbi:MAG: calcium/sodium antiporter [Acidobacteriota bacterium]|jgi:cation:H+ antiporter
MTVALFLLGLALLLGGAEALVRGAAALAARLGITPLAIGLTVVAFGTSAPELAASILAARAGAGDIAVGNVVGSNIFNVLFILGLAAVIAPLVVQRQLVRVDVPVMIAVSLLVVPLAWDGRISRAEGALLLGGVILYTVLLLRAARQDPEDGAPSPAQGTLLGQLALVVAGLAALVLGARWLVAGAVALARVLGLSELIIGLTVVAAGTSLPEVAASVVAALRGQRDIAVGNVVGSNIFNILCVLGGAALVGGGVPVAAAARHLDIPVMIAVAVACLPIFFTGHRISRWEGALFLAYYLAYTLYLVLQAQHHDAAPLLGWAMLTFALPLTAITLAVLAIRALRRE